MCDHKTIEPTENENEWACTGCHMLFVPALALIDTVEKNDEVLDTVTAVFSATLWDLHERAFAIHGDPMPPDRPLEDAICEKTGHVRDPETNVCTRCGADSPFLGG